MTIISLIILLVLRSSAGAGGAKRSLQSSPSGDTWHLFSPLGSVLEFKSKGGHPYCHTPDVCRRTGIDKAPGEAIPGWMWGSGAAGKTQGSLRPYVKTGKELVRKQGSERESQKTNR